jgi:hypothetical protein
MSGLLATPECPRRRVELFIDGTEPTQPDNVYQTFTVDRLTGLLADNNTPLDQRVERVYAVLPQEARDWGVRNGIPLPPSGAAVRLTEQDTGLRLLAPDPYTIFQISPIIPAASQRLRFTVGAPPETQAITYTLDGETLGTVDASPWSLWWTLQQGDHELVAHALMADGSTLTTDAIPFSVTTYAPPQSYTDDGQ